MFILLCIDEKKNSFIFHRKETDSVFQYYIDTEKWEFVCPWNCWANYYSVKYGIVIKKRKKKENG